MKSNLHIVPKMVIFRKYCCISKRKLLNYWFWIHNKRRAKSHRSNTWIFLSGGKIIQQIKDCYFLLTRINKCSRELGWRKCKKHCISNPKNAFFAQFINGCLYYINLFARFHRYMPNLKLVHFNHCCKFLANLEFCLHQSKQVKFGVVLMIHCIT